VNGPSLPINDSPVLKLQDLASTSSTNIEDLLSKAKVISVKLGQNDISEWLEHELKGYPNDVELPDYRVVRGSKVVGWNPFHGWIPFQLMNLMEKDPDTYQILTTINFNNAISMIAEYAKSEKTLYCDLPEPATEFLQRASDCDFRLCWPVSPTLMTRMISHVRSKILDWSLLLESKGIYGEGLLFSPKEKEEAKSVTYNNIINNNGNGMTVLGNVESNNSVVGGTVSNVHQQNIITGDFSTLEHHLKEHGIDDTDIEELKQSVEQKPKLTSKEEVEKGFGAWIGKMTGKAFTGAIQIASAAAPALLTNYICHYYGIPV